MAIVENKQWQLKERHYKQRLANKPLKQTAYACHALCKKANPAPRYGGLVPPLVKHKETNEDTQKSTR